MSIHKSVIAKAKANCKFTATAAKGVLNETCLVRRSRFYLFRTAFLGLKVVFEVFFWGMIQNAFFTKRCVLKKLDLEVLCVSGV